MKNTNRLMQKWAGCFAVMLAVALITGCQSASAGFDKCRLLRRARAGNSGTR